MCWIGKDIPKIAEKDIPCKKVVNFFETFNKLYAYYQSFEYELGKTYDQIIRPVHRTSGGTVEIYSGFHCYNNNVFVLYTQENSVKVIFPTSVVGFYTQYGGCLSRPVIVNCIIPKGAVYYENGVGEIVSTKLQIVSIVEKK